MMSKERLFVLLSYVLLAFVAYRNCFDIFIPGDNYSISYLFGQEGLAGIGQLLRFTAPYFVGFPFLYGLHQLFGTDPFAWMFLSITFHVLDGFLVFLIASRLLKIFRGENATPVAFFAGLVFLISPYQTEAVVWIAFNMRCMLHASVTLGGLYLLTHLLENCTTKKILAIHFLFLLGLFSYEFTFVVPVIYSAFFIVFQRSGKSGVSLKMFLTRIIFPQAIFIGTYFLTCKLTSGHWLFHDGAFGEVAQTGNYPKTLLKYFAKFFLFYRYLPLGEFDELLRSFSENPLIIALFGLCVLGLAAFAFWRLSKNNRETGYLLAVLFTCFLISLLPVLSLDSSFLKYIYPDRYGYLPSVFFSLFLVFSIYFLLEKYAIPVLAGYAVLCWVLLGQTIPIWEAANGHCNALVQNFKPFQKYDRVFVLNVPAYYQGVAAFRMAFPQTIAMKNNFPPENIRVISGCYQESSADTLTSVIVKENTVRVTGPIKDTPHFSTDAGWAKSYETDEYTVVFEPGACAYTLTFKQEIPPNSAFIWASGNDWKKAE